MAVVSSELNRIRSHAKASPLVDGPNEAMNRADVNDSSPDVARSQRERGVQSTALHCVADTSSALPLSGIPLHHWQTESNHVEGT